MKYNKEYKEGLHAAILFAAEKLASEVDCNGLNNHIMYVEYENENFELVVDCSITNYEYEEETNSQSFNVEVFCTSVVIHESKTLTLFLANEIYLETLYKD